MTHNPHSISDWLGYLTHNEIYFLERLAKSLPADPTIINIGAGGGTSGLTFRMARPEAQLYTLDIQFGSSPYGCIEGEIEMIKSNQLYDEAYYHWIVGDSKDTGMKWDANKKVNMVFVDGNHSLEGASGDITIWLNNLVPGGIIAIHDYKKPKGTVQWLGVDMAVDNLLVGKYKHIETVDTLIAFYNERI